jgi:energy-coupling factor transport system ATP-binding protein
VLVLDEPTSALDPPAAEEVLAVLTRLVHDLGLTVVLAEHRLERVVQYADSVALVDGGRVRHGSAEAVLRDAPVAPPVVELGRLVRADPLPLSVRTARAACAPLREQLRATGPDGGRPGSSQAPAATGDLVVEVRELHARHGTVPALHGIELDIGRGEVVALMGRNGAGKSTLLATLAGVHRPASGHVTVDGEPTTGRGAGDVVRRIALVPQQPADLLFAQTVDAECAAADRDAGATAGTTRALLDRTAPGIEGTTHPRDLSEGRRLSLAIAVVAVHEPAVLALDEPTRGLDYGAKRRLVAELRDRAAAGTTVVLATHDVELAVAVADRIVVLADGEVVTDGPVREVATASPLFAPQVAKILAPLPLLSVDEVTHALAAAAGAPA